MPLPHGDIMPPVVDSRMRRATADLAFSFGALCATGRPISVFALRDYYRAIDRGDSVRLALWRLWRHVLFDGWGPLTRLYAGAAGRLSLETQGALLEATLLGSGITGWSLDEAHPLVRCRLVMTVAAPKALSLCEALDIVRDAYGDAWLYDRARWRTADGAAPAAAVWTQAFAILGAHDTRPLAPAPQPVPTPIIMAPTLMLARGADSTLLH